MDSCWRNIGYRYNGYRSFGSSLRCCGWWQQPGKRFRKVHYHNAGKALAERLSVHFPASSGYGTKIPVDSQPVHFMARSTSFLPTTETLFSAVQATVQAPQPEQLFRSILIPHLIPGLSNWDTAFLLLHNYLCRQIYQSPHFFLPR